MKFDLSHLLSENRCGDQLMQRPLEGVLVRSWIALHEWQIHPIILSCFQVDEGHTCNELSFSLQVIFIVEIEVILISEPLANWEQLAKRDGYNKGRVRNPTLVTKISGISTRHECVKSFCPVCIRVIMPSSRARNSPLMVFRHLWAANTVRAIHGNCSLMVDRRDHQ